MDLSKIRAFAFDIDGVATDGGVFCFSDGDLLRTYDAKDGFAIPTIVLGTVLPTAKWPCRKA